MIYSAFVDNIKFYGRNVIIKVFKSLKNNL